MQRMDKSKRDGFRSEGAYRAVLNSRGLRHYASPYYDPVKAHEYYEEHKKLKGKRSSAALSDEGKEIWKYTKDQITEHKKADLKTSNESKKQSIENHRAEAKAARERISARLKQLQAHIKSISTKGLSKEERARVSAEKEKLRENYRAESDAAKVEREQVAAKLKGACEATRVVFELAKAGINSSYEETYQNEYDKILAEYAKPEKSSGGSKGKNIDSRALEQYKKRGLM